MALLQRSAHHGVAAPPGCSDDCNSHEFSFQWRMLRMVSKHLLTRIVNMVVAPETRSTRERIVDAAAAVMRHRGLANTTTKLIAAEAGFSEATLYKHFTDKQDLFLAVLKERLPLVRSDLVPAGQGELVENLVGLTGQLLDFFVQSVPLAASIFGSPELLAQHRAGIASRGAGPWAPVAMLVGYLDAERSGGRIRAEADTAAAAQLLVGAAFHQAFLAAYEGLETVPSRANLARALVATVMPALT
jgi:AcrR family transcriptional regulator